MAKTLKYRTRQYSLEIGLTDSATGNTAWATYIPSDNEDAPFDMNSTTKQAIAERIRLEADLDSALKSINENTPE